MKRLMLYRGDTPTLEFTVKDLEGQPIDLTEWQVFFAVKIGETTVLERECEVWNPPEGKARVTLTASDTDAIGVGVGELEGRKNGEVRTFGQILVMFLEDVRK